VPEEFFEMLAISQQMEFDEQPDYKWLKHLLQKVIKRQYSIKKITDIDIINNNNEKVTKKHH
jgi:hypothetical protein